MNQNLAFELSEDWQTDYTTGTIDECKQLVTQYFKWEGADAQDRKFNQSRKLKSRYGARNPFQEPSLELSSQAT